MNCEKYQDLLSDFVDGSLASQDHKSIEAHLSACGGCAEVRGDLNAIVTYCHEHRGEYDAVCALRKASKPSAMLTRGIISVLFITPLPATAAESATAVELSGASSRK